MRHDGEIIRFAPGVCRSESGFGPVRLGRRLIEAALSELKNVETGELDARWLAAKLAVGDLDLEEGRSLPADQAITEIRARAQRLSSRNRAAS